MNDKFPRKKSSSSSQPEPWWKRFVWLIAIWAGSVMSLGIFAFLIRKLMTAAGMST